MVNNRKNSKDKTVSGISSYQSQNLEKNGPFSPNLKKSETNSENFGKIPKISPSQENALTGILSPSNNRPASRADSTGNFDTGILELLPVVLAHQSPSRKKSISFQDENETGNLAESYETEAENFDGQSQNILSQNSPPQNSQSRNSQSKQFRSQNGLPHNDQYSENQSRRVRKNSLSTTALGSGFEIYSLA